MVGIVPELKRNVMDARFRNGHDVDDVVFPIARQEMRDPGDVVRRPEAKKFLIELSKLVAFRRDYREWPRRSGATPSLLKPGAGASAAL